jgi:hypothetical protein
MRTLNRLKTRHRLRRFSTEPARSAANWDHLTRSCRTHSGSSFLGLLTSVLTGTHRMAFVVRIRSS